MTDTWQISLCSMKPMSKCLLSTFCWFVGVGIVQSQTFEINDKGKVMPIICSSLLCCIGAGRNRSKTRKLHKIKGSCLVDCLIYSTPLCCCASVQEFNESTKRKEDRANVKHAPAPMITNMIIIDPEPSIINTFRSMEIDESAYIEALPEMPKIVYLDDNNGHPLSKDTSADQPIDTSSNSDEENKEPESEKGGSHEIQVPQRQVIVLKEIAIEPLDGDDPQIYSKIVGTGPFSFLKGDPYMPNSPPPTYLTHEVLKKPKSTDSKDIMYGLDVHKKGGLYCTDQEALNRQKGIVGDVIKQLVKVLAKGLGAVSISLPIRIFEPRSTCERLVDRFSFASYYLGAAAKETDPVSRLKKVMAFAISGLYLGTRQEKPFNPLLGETFQGTFDDGTLVYVEHTAHNPPTDHFDVIGRGYRLYGYYELDGSLSWNELTGEFRGFTYVQFPGQLIKFTQPKFMIGGFTFGDRTLNWQGEIEFWDHQNGLSAAIRIGDDKNKWSIKKKDIKRDSFFGKIWKFDTGTNKKGEALVSVYGSWLKKFVAVDIKGKEKIWVINREVPKRHIPSDFPIPSDWRYREDLIWLFRKNQELASSWKLRVENRQRLDRGLRGKH